MHTKISFSGHQEFLEIYKINVGINQKIMNEPHYNQNILDLFFFCFDSH